MRKILLVAAMVISSPDFAWADSITITNDNSSLKFTRDNTGFNLGVPNDPVQLPRTLEWTVDGRRILVYPSGPSTFLDLGHLHSGLHVAANQIHGQGPLLGFGTGATAGTVTGGVVYTVDGGTSGSGVSRISEKVDIHNKTSAALSLSLTGLGFKPTQASLEVPDLSGLTVTGTTVVFFQGNPQTDSLTDAPFAPITVLPVVSFSGFNPLFNQTFSLPAGAFLTMVTELNVTKNPIASFVAVPLLLVLILSIIGLATAVGTAAWRRRSHRKRSAPSLIPKRRAIRHARGC